jgi:hypothetical protein
MPGQVVAGLVYEDEASFRGLDFCVDPANRVISTLELRPPSRALALRRGRVGCQVASSSLLSLLILCDSRPHNPAVLPYGVLRPWTGRL